MRTEFSEVIFFTLDLLCEFLARSFNGRDRSPLKHNLFTTFFRGQVTLQYIYAIQILHMWRKFSVNEVCGSLASGWLAVSSRRREFHPTFWRTIRFADLDRLEGIYSFYIQRRNHIARRTTRHTQNILRYFLRALFYTVLMIRMSCVNLLLLPKLFWGIFRIEGELQQLFIVFYKCDIFFHHNWLLYRSWRCSISNSWSVYLWYHLLINNRPNKEIWERSSSDTGGLH